MGTRGGQTPTDGLGQLKSKSKGGGRKEPGFEKLRRVDFKCTALLRGGEGRGKGVSPLNTPKDLGDGTLHHSAFHHWALLRWKAPG